jgi:hypothetical protein
MGKARLVVGPLDERLGGTQTIPEECAQMQEHATLYELGIGTLWLYCAATDRGRVRQLENLYALYELGRRLGELRAFLKAKTEMDKDIGISCWQCAQGLQYLIGGEALQLPRTNESATRLLASIDKLISGDDVGSERLKQEYGTPLDGYFTGPIKTDLDTFQIALSEEVKLLPLFSVEAKGNLSIDRLVNGASDGYGASTLALLDDFMKREIDEAGRCLAFARPTACGFHILRAVEIILKAYVLAATGALPKLNKRNWGEYITQLSDAGASASLVDFLRILKAKRNPLMHPKDTLELEDAIGIFCICQNAIETLVAEVRSKGLDSKFANALAALPTI